MSTARSWVLIPMKRFALAKSRLSVRLAEADRAALARSMFERVLGAARACDENQTCVITNGDDVAELALRAGAHVLRDPQPTAALGALLDWGIEQLVGRHATRVVVLMGDLPRIVASDVRGCFEALEEVEMVVCADRRRKSTNALGLRVPFGAKTAFGDAESYALHLARARELGARVRELVNPRIAHDVDTEGDL